MVTAASQVGTSRADRSSITAETASFARDALTEAKHEGLRLAVRARWIALAIITVFLPLLNPNPDVIYYMVLNGLFALIGWAQLRVGALGLSRRELALLYCDLALLTFIIVVPNPWNPADWPTAVQYRFENFIYFFVLLAGGTLAYSWRTVAAMGVWTSGVWLLGLFWVYMVPNAQPELSQAVNIALDGRERLAGILDPNDLNLELRAQEVIVFVIVAAILAVTVRRSSDLMISHAVAVHERSNLARYFSPNVVDELSLKTEPLKEVRTQDVAVLFVDIVGFTSFANDRDPQDVIETLRSFHGLMEEEVFRHGGTLDKYLGDGLMATFGTPFVGPSDASNAFKCAQAMIEALRELNARRIRKGQPELRGSFGLHYGPAVLGDIGANRLEFAVIGNTVNIASRLEGLSRPLKSQLVVSDAVITQVHQEEAPERVNFDGFVRQEPQPVRGVAAPVPVWTYAPQ